MKRIFKNLFIIFTVAVMAASGISAVPVSAATVKNITVKASVIKAQGARKAIQDVLDKARKKATAKKPYVITVAKGNYDLTGTLKIYSNTTLSLKGVTLNAKRDSNVIIVGEPTAENKGAKGYYYKNITISGGTLNGKKRSGTMLKIGHASNIKITNMTFKNAKNAHIMEVAGVKKLTVENCRFLNQTLTKNQSSPCYEAIQLDVLVSTHMLGYRSEDLTNKNITITDCIFKNVPRGVGSHTSIINNPMTGISITDCTFTNIASAAIQGMGWENVKITGNTVSATPRGIVCYTVFSGGKGSFTAGQLQAEGKVKTGTSNLYNTPNKDQKIYIADNKITLNSKKDPYTDVTYARVGIMVSGTEITSQKKLKDNSGLIPCGNYYASGVEITQNTVKTTGHGIRVVDTRNAEITNNKITFGTVPDKDTVAYYGIEATFGSKKVSINSNSIKKATCNGIYVNRSSQVSSIKSNAINTTGKYGIDVQGAEVNSLSHNTLTDTGNVGIMIFSGGDVSRVCYNTVTGTKKCGIQITTNSNADYVTYNEVINSGEYGIMFSSNSTGIEFLYNNVSGATKRSETVSSNSFVQYIDYK